MDRTLQHRGAVEYAMNVAEEETILSYYPDNSIQTVWKHDCHVYHREADDIVPLLCLVLKHRSMSLPIALCEYCSSIILNCKRKTTYRLPP